MPMSWWRKGVFPLPLIYAITPSAATWCEASRANSVNGWSRWQRDSVGTLKLPIVTRILTDLESTLHLTVISYDDSYPKMRMPKTW